MCTAFKVVDVVEFVVVDSAGMKNRVVSVSDSNKKREHDKVEDTLRT